MVCSRVDSLYLSSSVCSESGNPFLAVAVDGLRAIVKGN